jgi:hypothetical protein
LSPILPLEGYLREEVGTRENPVEGTRHAASSAPVGPARMIGPRGARSGVAGALP